MLLISNLPSVGSFHSTFIFFNEKEYKHWKTLADQWDETNDQRWLHLDTCEVCCMHTLPAQIHTKENYFLRIKRFDLDSNKNQRTSFVHINSWNFFFYFAGRSQIRGGRSLVHPNAPYFLEMRFGSRFLANTWIRENMKRSKWVQPPSIRYIYLVRCGCNPSDVCWTVCGKGSNLN